MDRQQMMASMEAILFTMGESVEADRIAQALETTADEIHALAQEMMSRYESEDRGIRMIRLEGNYQLCTKKEYYETNGMY